MPIRATPLIKTKNSVLAVPPASPARAEDHFASRFGFETDCWDVHQSLNSEEPGFVPIDVRSPELFAKGHVPGAINIPQMRLTEERVAEFAADLLFVVYCAGPHCNGAAKAAVRLARLGRPVKEMIGGVTGWIDEGFELAT